MRPRVRVRGVGDALKACVFLFTRGHALHSSVGESICDMQPHVLPEHGWSYPVVQVREKTVDLIKPVIRPTRSPRCGEALRIFTYFYPYLYNIEKIVKHNLHGPASVRRRTTGIVPIAPGPMLPLRCPSHSRLSPSFSLTTGDAFFHGYGVLSRSRWTHPPPVAPARHSQLLISRKGAQKLGCACFGLFRIFN